MNIKNQQNKQPLYATAYQSHFDRYGVPYSFEQLEQQVMNPLNCSKFESPLILPTDAQGKTKSVIEARNRMTLLWADLDSGNKPLAEVIGICNTYQITKALIYSTASACREKKGVIQGYRWRVVILPSQALGIDNWKILQLSLAKIFGGGLEAAKPTQGFFVPSNDGGYYEYAIV
jgi:hypothetical protein